MQVNLDQVLNPHPEILKAYTEKNAMDLFYKYQAIYENEKRLFDSAKSTNNPITHKITGIYRERIGESEYCYFHEHLATKDHFKNPVDHSRLVGRYDLPEITQYFDPGSNALSPAQINSTETKYEFLFEDIKEQLNQWYNDKTITEKTNYYVATTGRKYSKPYTFAEFITHSFDDLVTLGKYGTLRPETIEAEQQLQKRRGQIK